MNDQADKQHLTLEEIIIKSVILPFQDGSQEHVNDVSSKFILEKQDKLGNFLDGHAVQQDQRFRMVDWMVQVFRVLKKSTPNTFFQAINIMDDYFKKQKDIGVNIPKSELHMVGIVSIMLSSKLEDVIPIFMDQIIEDACHGKYSRPQIVEQEAKVIKALQFKFQRMNIYQESCIKVKTLFNQFQKIKLQAKDKDTFMKLVTFLSELATHSYDLAGADIE